MRLRPLVDELLIVLLVPVEVFRAGERGLQQDHDLEGITFNQLTERNISDETSSLIC